MSKTFPKKAGGIVINIKSKAALKRFFTILICDIIHDTKVEFSRLANVSIFNGIMHDYIRSCNNEELYTELVDSYYEASCALTGVCDLPISYLESEVSIASPIEKYIMNRLGVSMHPISWDVFKKDTKGGIVYPDGIIVEQLAKEHLDNVTLYLTPANVCDAKLKFSEVYDIFKKKSPNILVSGRYKLIINNGYQRITACTMFEKGGYEDMHLFKDGKFVNIEYVNAADVKNSIEYIFRATDAEEIPEKRADVSEKLFGKYWHDMSIIMYIAEIADRGNVAFITPDRIAGMMAKVMFPHIKVFWLQKKANGAYAAYRYKYKSAPLFSASIVD